MEIIKRFFEAVASFPELAWYSKAILIAWPILTFFFLYLFLGGHALPRSILSMSDQELRKEALETSKQILDFIAERQLNEPQVDFNNWDESTNQMIKYNSETPKIYASKFGSKVVALRDELKKRGLSDKDLDMLCERATNSIVIEIGAIKLGSLAYQLPQKDK